MINDAIHPIQIDWTIPRIGQCVVLKHASPPSTAIGVLMAYEGGKWLLGITGSLQSKKIIDASWHISDEFVLLDYFSDYDMKAARQMAALNQLLGPRNFPPDFPEVGG
jgi:hypothetical protein